jgi:hypothetical protein
LVRLTTRPTPRLSQRGADQPLAPIEQEGCGAIPGSNLGGIGFNLMLAFLAPNDQPNAGAAALSSVIGGPGLDFTYTPIAALS